MNLEGSFISCQFSKVIATWSPMGSMRSSTMGSFQIYRTTGIYFFLWNRPQMQYKSSYFSCLLLLYLSHYCTQGLAYHAGLWCISWGSELSKMAGGFSPLVTVSSGRMKAIQQGESVLASVNLISPYHLIRCVVSSATVSYHQVLSAGQLKSVSIVCMIVRVSGISLADNSWGGTLHLFLDFLFENWEEYCPCVGQLQWSSFIWKKCETYKIDFPTAFPKSLVLIALLPTCSAFVYTPILFM